MTDAIEFNEGLIRRYDKAGPRYTSYPTAVEFHHGFTADTYAQHIALSNQRGGPLSLYFHVPFCDTVCFYCACNKIITISFAIRSAQPICHGKRLGIVT